MNKGAVLLYKCRRCSELVRNIHVPDGTLATSCIINNYELPKEWSGITHGILDIHRCKDGNLRVADFIGSEFDK